MISCHKSLGIFIIKTNLANMVSKIYYIRCHALYVSSSPFKLCELS